MKENQDASPAYSVFPHEVDRPFSAEDTPTFPSDEPPLSRKETKRRLQRIIRSLD